MKRIPSLVVVLCGVLSVCCHSQRESSHRSATPDNKVAVEIRRYGLEPGSWHMYSSMGTSPDGDVYAGICNYSFSQKLSDVLNGAWLVRYDPDEDKSHPLGDMQDVTGQRGRDKAFAQSKIHTPILFGQDGNAYFATHSVERDYLPDEYRDRFTEGYPGGHWIRWDRSTGQFDDLGIAASGESIMGLAMDPKRRKLYGTTHEKSLLVEYDIDSGVSKVRGSIGDYPTRVVTCLADGNVYTFDERGYVLRYDPRTKAIEKLDLRIPHGGYEADLISVFALCDHRSRRGFYGITTLIDEVTVKNVIKGGFLFEFVLDDNGHGELRDLGNAAATEASVTSEIGLYHAMTLGTDGRVYWSAPESGKPVHLMSYDPATGKKRDHGEMWSKGGDTHVHAVYAACTGKDGKLYWGGLRKSDGDPKWDNEVVLIICDPEDLRVSPR